jgi:hypothetical protein
METKRPEKYPLRRRHMGLAGAIIIISQAITQYFSASQSTKNISSDVQQIRADQERYFARKDDLERVSHRIDTIAKDISDIKERSSGINGLITKNRMNSDGTAKF